jgi:protein tyrosine phosphatase (PTP) superfamily phosphohydrolase (DUF442 family)
MLRIAVNQLAIHQLMLILGIVLFINTMPPKAFADSISAYKNSTKPWAKPILEEGVPNLHKVSDKLYRSAQPTKIGMQNLKKLGIRTIFNLRSFNSDRDEIGNTGLGYEHVYMKAWHPERKEIIRFLQIVSNDDRTPILLHCQHGSDRTGLMTAIYRVAIEGWTKDAAIDEMINGGFGYNKIWVNIPTWIRELDIDSIKKEAGL